MSQEDRSGSLAASQREDQFGFADQRSCRCVNSPNEADASTRSLETERQVCPEAAPSAKDGSFVDGGDDGGGKHRLHEQRGRSNETAPTVGPQLADNNRTISGLRYAMDGDNSDHFSRGGRERVSTPASKSHRETNVLVESETPDVDFLVSQVEQKLHHQQQQQMLEQRLRDSNRRISPVRAGRGQMIVETENFSQFEMDEDREIEERETADPRQVSSSPGRTNDERSSATAASSVSFANETNSRVHGMIDTSINEAMLQNRGQQTPGGHHQVPIINAINNNRTSNLRSLRDNNRNNRVDLNDEEVEEIHRINANANNVDPVSRGPGFRNLHPERMIHPLQRGTNPPPKGTFDAIQVCTSDTVEKDKCQCHLVQQHKHQPSQLLSHVPQREQAQHHHHHHHQQQQQQQQQQPHRHKMSQQRAQQQQQQQQQSQQQQQQQMYRHHHYHHPHQHIGQQQELRRAHSDETSSRKQMSSSGQDEESDDVIETSLGSHQPPALPPRPPPRPNRRYEQNSTTAYDPGPNNSEDGGCCKKYVVLCCLCGGLSAAVGSLFLAVHAVLSAHTASLALFETVPSYIPGTMLILMGFFTILLARRKHRYGFLMKMCGSVGVVCALVCVLVTVTTTVVHMSRLQGLRECIYTERARSCTCYGSTQGRISSDPGVLFEETPHCEAVHGALYDCLRALFGVSVAGILACIFSCMLLYQLLSHEKKKMYWEQLQLRCRSLYGQGGSGAVGGPTGGSCGCCNDCSGASPWWAQTPGNLYTPNPDLAPFSRRWRLPWSRSRGPAPTPDSNYGFHGQSRNTVVMRSSGSSSGEPGENTPGPYSVLTDESQTGGGSGGAPYSLINSTSSAPYAACTSSVASYSLLENGPVSALWGPPPPYSDPNSPARRPQLNEERRPPATLRSPTTNPAASGTPINLSTNRMSKRTMDNFEPANCEEYRQRSMNMRPSDNYENTEEVLSSSTDADIEMGSLHHRGNRHSQRQQDEEGTKGRRTRKALKGVENGGFQQETAGASLTKQSESELYFGDVSSCCGPESSFYDLAVDKEEEQSGQIDPTDSLMDYPACNRFSKQRQSSKRSRQQQPLPSSIIPEGSVDTLTESYSPLNNPPLIDDLSRSSSTRGPYLAPDAQYEVIAQQTRYTYYNPINGEHVLDMQQRCSSLASLAYRNGNSNNDAIDADQVDGTSAIDYPSERLALEHPGNNRGKPGTPITRSPTPSGVLMPTPPSSPLSPVSNLTQRCTNDNTGNSRESVWQTDHQTRAIEGVCPVNV